MRVFILSTGRAGSMAIMKACNHITNYTAAHESRSHIYGDEKLDYPEDHIESDNRLSWFLGRLDEKFGDDAIYVHLIRDKNATVKSLNNRWKEYISINKAYLEGMLMTPQALVPRSELSKVNACYYDTVNSNIDFFLRDKTKKMTIRLENIEEDFKQFWELINAEGSLDDALREFSIKHNKTAKRTINWRYRIKLFLYSIIR